MIYIFRFVLYYVYYPKESKKSPTGQKLAKEWKDSIIAFHMMTVFSILVVSATFLFIRYFGYEHENMRRWAKGLGLFALVTSTIQYVPQIVETWKRKSIGSLSIMSMMMQIPGTCIFVYTLIFRPESNYTNWIGSLAAAIFQGILFVLCVYYRRINNPEELI